MNNENLPTLQDVADVAGVSTATVSRCINDPEKVALNTRTRIENAVLDLGYTPHFGGRVLASNRTNSVGAIIPTMANAMFAGGLQSFQEVLGEAGVTLLVASSGYDPEHELRQIQSLLANGADGLLLIGDERPPKTWEFLGKRRVPYVIAWGIGADPTTPYVGFDNRKAAKSIAAEVLANGHRQIAIIAGETRNNDRARERLIGFREKIYSGGGKIVHESETDYSFEAGGAAFEKAMNAEHRPTAIICGNDVLAAGALLRASQLGMKVPDDVSVTGFDDIGIAQVVTPALTTVRVPQQEMGREAARMLLAKLHGEEIPNGIELHTNVVRRASLGPVPRH